MSVVARAARSLREEGLRPTLDKVVAVAADGLFDLRYGVETQAWAELRTLSIRGDNRDHGARYQPTHVWPLRRMLHALQAQYTPGGAFVDLGCGKGRALMVAAEFGFPVIRGVEFAHELCTVAARNCAAYKRRRQLPAEFHIVESDVVSHRFAGDETIVFMFNPFAAGILNRVLDHLTDSLTTHPRRLLILYHNPRQSPVIASRARFVSSGSHTFGPSTFETYTATP